MDGAALARLFSLCSYTVAKNVDGLTHADSLVRPGEGGNCANWVLGHIVDTRNSLFRIAGLETFWGKEASAPYSRGSEPVNADRAMDIAKILGTYRSTQEPLESFLRQATEETLATPLAEPHEILGKTVGSAMFFLAFHEIYHCGQLGVLRRVAGKDSGIP